MHARTLIPILAVTLVTTPQLAAAAQPDEGASATASVGVGSEAAGSETAPEATAVATSDDGSTAVAVLAPAPTVYDGIKGKLRMHFDVDFAIQPRPNDYQDTNSPQVVRPLYGLGFGYGIHKNLVLGAKLAFNFTRVRDRTDAVLDADALAVQRQTMGSFMPYIEYLPLATGRILPFVGFRAGFAWQTDAARQKGDVGGMEVDVGTRQSQIGPQVGLSGGAHFFLTRSFSLDAAALFDVRWTFARARQLGDGAMDPAPWAPAASIINLGLALGISAWF